MNLLPIELVSMDGDKLVTDSRRVAQHFGKRHDSVLRAFDGITCSEEFSRHNFAAAVYLDEQGKQRRSVQMTKDGFMFLAMGFSGPEAAKIKEAYINAFNSMADALQKRDASLWQQMHALIAKETASQVRAAFGSRLMLSRKKELPGIRREEDRLRSEIQPGLFPTLRRLC